VSAYLRDNVQETSATQGNGAIALQGAADETFRTFTSAFSSGPVVAGSAAGKVKVCAVVRQGALWESGYYELDIAGKTLAPLVITGSSSAGAKLTWADGTRDVWCAPAAGSLLVLDPAGALDLGEATAIRMGGRRITDLGAPTDPNDAVNRRMLDQHFGAGGGAHALATINAAGFMSAAQVAALNALAGTSVPVGAVIAWAGGQNPPPGWRLCDGSNLLCASYPVLYGWIGRAFGAGDGSTTFGLPDLRGRTIFGNDAMGMGSGSAGRITVAKCGIDGRVRGAAGGTQSVTLTEAQIPGHTHPLRMSDNRNTAPGGAEQLVTVGGGNATTTQSTGGGNDHTNMPPLLIMDWYITTGVFS
jgi:microcystin-dependent protein